MNDNIINIIDTNYDPKLDKKIHSWKNTDNMRMYENQPLEVFQKFSTLSRLADDKDIDAIYERYIYSSGSVLELGAGYGRVIDALLRKGYKGSITAIERDKKLYDVLVSSFGSDVNTFLSDIADMKLSRKYDVILWMWIGFTEFAKAEQADILQKVASYLNNDGIMAIDLVKVDEELVQDDSYVLQNYLTKTCYGENYHYFPTHDEVVSYAKKHQLKIIDVIPYVQTHKNKKKIIYILQRLP